MKFHGKSNFFPPKENTKSFGEKNLEEEEFKKYDAYVNRLNQVVSNKDRTLSQSENEFSNKRIPSAGKNKSNLIRLTVSRTKDDRNDKDFLSNFMNNDSLPILPKNLHLLSDNDTNQSISNTEKFKNLSNLMLDDRESYAESCFIKNVEDRLILKIYSTLGREAKEVFLEEENNEKLNKKRTLFHILNNIKVPKFGFEKPIVNENNQVNNNSKKKDKKNKKEEKEEIDNKEEKNDSEEDEEKENEKGCYFKQKEKGYFHLPELINEKEFKKNEKRKEYRGVENLENFWDPEIDADILSYINHNIIRIEDIYNSKEKEEIKKEEDMDDIEEDKVTPVNAREIISSDSDNDDDEDEQNYIYSQLRMNNKNSNVNEEDEAIPKRSKIKFSEFCGISPYQAEVSFQVDSDKIKESKKSNELKDKFTFRLNQISSYEEKNFPKKGTSLSNELIFKIAERNEKNEIVTFERFTIEPTIKKFYTEVNDNLREEVKKKTVQIKSNYPFSSSNIMESPPLPKYNFRQSYKYNNLNFNLNLDEDKRKSKKSLKKNEIRRTNKIGFNEENKIDEINNNENNDNENNIMNIYTLKDLLNNDTILSKSNKKNNNSPIFSGNDSFSGPKNYLNPEENNFKDNLENIIKDDEDEKFQRKEYNNDINNISYLYSDKQSGSQKVNNDLKLSFSSRQSQ